MLWTSRRPLMINGIGARVSTPAPDSAASGDLAASSVRTREAFGWEPTGPILIEDIDAGAYFH